MATQKKQDEQLRREFEALQTVVMALARQVDDLKAEVAALKEHRK